MSSEADGGESALGELAGGRASSRDRRSDFSRLRLVGSGPAATALGDLLPPTSDDRVGQSS